MYELGAIGFDSRKSMEVLHEMLARFEHAFSLFAFPEKFSMQFHDCENLAERRRIFSREKTPRIAEGMPADHEAVEIFHSIFCSFFMSISILGMNHFCYTIVIIRDVAVREDGDVE